MIQQCDCFFTYHTSLDSLVATIKCVLSKYLSNFSESCLVNLRVRCVLKTECLFNLVIVTFKLISTNIRLVLVLRKLPLNNRDVIIEMSFHSILPHFSFFHSNEV